MPTLALNCTAVVQPAFPLVGATTFDPNEADRQPVMRLLGHGNGTPPGR